MMEAQESRPVACPCCGRLTDSLKLYRVATFLFLLFAFVARSQQLVGCPRCVRGKIGRFALVNVVTANLLWPVIILPWSLILLACSFLRGHSPEVRRALAVPVTAVPGE